MKLLEKFIYSIILFSALYVIISLGLRLFEVTSDFTSHLIGGLIATVSAVLLFIYLLIRK